MSVESVAVVLHHSAASGTAKNVLIGIANHDGDGGSWPSIASLAKYARVTERNVQVAIRKLVKLGEIEVHLQAGGNRQTDPRYRANRYDILLHCPADCDRTKNHRSIHDGCLAAEFRGLEIMPDCQDEGCRIHHPSGVSAASPLTESRGDAECSQGVSLATPEPSFNQRTPQPPASGGRPASLLCTKPGQLPHANCRGCGTTTRQLKAAAAARAAEQRIAAQRALVAAERAAATERRGRPPTEAELAARQMARAGVQQAVAR